MKDLQKLANQCVKDLVAIGIQPGQIYRFVADTRAKRRWGLCRWVESKGWEIKIMARLLEDDVSDQAVKDTIMHELLHTVKGAVGHTGLWKECAHTVNRKLPQYTIKRASGFEEKGIAPPAVTRQFPYAVRCTHCGQEYPRQKMSSLIQHPEHYRCGLCKGALERIY